MTKTDSDGAKYSAAWRDSFPPDPDDGFDVAKFERPTSISERLQSSEATKYAGPVDWYREFKKVPERADDEAERQFPNQARDSSVKNAFRHALGTGRAAQMLGADSGIPIVKDVAAGAAKAMGYMWEGFGKFGGDDKEAQRDSRHDLNANAIGADDAKHTKGFDELAQRLKMRAAMSRKEDPPALSEQSPGYFTHTK